MKDEVFAALRKDWNSVHVDGHRVTTRYASHRRKVKRRIDAALLALVVIACLSIFMASMALLHRNPLAGVASLAFMAALPVAWIGFAIAQQEVQLAYVDTPLGHLQEMRHWLDVEHRLLFSARWVSGILAVAAGSVLGLWTLGYSSTRGTLVLVLTWGPTAIFVWLWQARRSVRLGREMARLESLIAELEHVREEI